MTRVFLCIYNNQKSYWCGTTRSLNSTRGSAPSNYNGIACSSGDEHDEGGDDDTLLIPNGENTLTQTESNSQHPAAASSGFFEAGPPGLQAGISIRNLRKVTAKGPRNVG